MKTYFIELKDRKGLLHYEQIYIRDFQTRNAANIKQLGKTASKLLGDPTNKYSVTGIIKSNLIVKSQHNFNGVTK